MIKRRKTKRMAIVAVVVFNLIFAFWLSLPKVPLLEGVAFSQVVYDDQNHLLRITTNKQHRFRVYTPLNKISPYLIKATLLEEDRHFYYEPAINPIALFKAFITTYVLHERRRGGSTISMQIARMRLQIDSKSILGKLKQIYYTFSYEKYYTKKQILTAYFNLAPYGGNISGIGAASMIYFKEEPKYLSLAQSLTLAVIPQNPNKRMPRDHHLNQILLKARNRLMRIWQKQYGMSDIEKANFKLPLQLFGRKQLPFYAPHFVDYVLAREHANMLNTTLNLRIQKRITRITRSYIRQHQSLGMSNAAILLIDRDSMTIKAMLGSANYFNSQIDGEVNGTLAFRSPGSTLKPFIYARAIQYGLIIPKTILPDVPMHFNNYTPENIDNHFMGPVTAQEALILSRNLPAVYIDSQLQKQHHDLYELLKQTKMPHLLSQSHYGLSLVLGGAEIQMVNLVRLYSALGNQGKLYDLQYLTPQSNSYPIQMLSPEAAYITLDMLRHHQEINEIPSGAWVDPLPKVAWKTGTSSAYRDAWAVGLFGHYVLAVWIGEFNSKSNKIFMGLTAAAPLLFKLIAAIHQQQNFQSLMPEKKYLNIRKIKVCAASGELPTKYCPRFVKTWFIPGVSPIKKDTVFRRTAIDPKTGLRTCKIAKNTIFKVYQYWPSYFLKLFTQAGIQVNSPPALMSNCPVYSTTFVKSQLHISTPQDNQTYHLLSGHDLIPFNASDSNAIKDLYWFVDGHYIATTHPSQTYFWHAIPGNHTITVFDTNGEVRTHLAKVTFG